MIWPGYQDITSKSPRLSEAAVARAGLLYEHQRRVIATRTDRFLGLLLLVEWIGTMAVAAILSPRAWSGASSSVHIHLVAAIVLGGVVALPAFGVSRLCAGQTWSRHAIGIAQVLMGSLLIHVTGGRIESHFYLFGSLAFLAFYRDWRVLVSASVIILADHLLRGVLLPASVYGVAYASIWRSVEHGFWVVFEDTVLIASCLQGQREMYGTATRRAELELKMDAEARYAAEHEANRVKSEFLANVSHEIRTPMTAIQGYADLLLDPSLGPSERLNYTQVIRRNSEHLLTVLNDVLDLSKIEAGRMTVEAVECSPAMIAREVTSLMRVRAADKRVDFALLFDTKIPEIIKSDPTRLRQILLNLVGNAIKFTEAGRVCVRVACEDEESLAPKLVFKVTDTGIGLSEGEIGKLFRAFAQGDASTTRKFGGTGLGLAICASLAKLLGGGIGVESVPGKGSVFTLRIETGPLLGVRMLSNPSEAVEEATRIAAPLSIGKIALSGSVLLAEDGRDNQLLIATILRKAGAVVEIAENGRIAVEKALSAHAAGSPFDVILMDMQMPELDGYAATSKLRLAKYTRPIIALTAHAMATDRAQCLAAGCDEYLTKPVDRARLLAAVRDALVRVSAPRISAACAALEPLASELAGDDDLCELVSTFAASLAGRAAAMTGARARQEWATLRVLAHQLKGAGGSYGFPSITAAAAELEALLKGGAPRDLQALEHRLQAVATLCRRAAMAQAVMAPARRRVPNPDQGQTAP